MVPSKMDLSFMPEDREVRARLFTELIAALEDAKFMLARGRKPRVRQVSIIAVCGATLRYHIYALEGAPWFIDDHVITVIERDKGHVRRRILRRERDLQRHLEQRNSG